MFDKGIYKQNIQFEDNDYQCPHCDETFESLEDWDYVDKGWDDVVRRCPECEKEVYL